MELNSHEFLDEDFERYDAFLAASLLESIHRFHTSNNPIVITNFSGSIYDIVVFHAISTYCSFASRPLYIKTTIFNQRKIQKKIGKFSRWEKKNSDAIFFDLSEERNFFDGCYTMTGESEEILERIYNAYYRDIL